MGTGVWFDAEHGRFWVGNLHHASLGIFVPQMEYLFNGYKWSEIFDYDFIGNSLENGNIERHFALYIVGDFPHVVQFDDSRFLFGCLI